MLKTKVALAGNRTPVSRVAGENSTTTTNAFNVVNFPCTITFKILHSC